MLWGNWHPAFRSFLSIAARGNVGDLADHPEYRTIRAVMEMRGCGCCILTFEHAQAYIREYFGIELSLFDVMAQEQRHLTNPFDGQLGFFYAFHGHDGDGDWQPSPPDMPLVFAYRHEGDLIHANAVHAWPGFDEVEIGLYFAHSAEMARQGDFDSFTLRRIENGRLQVIASFRSTRHNPLPLFETELAPFTDGVRLPPAATEHPLHYEVAALLRTLTSHSRIPGNPLRGAGGRRNYAYDVPHQLLMMAHERNDALLAGGGGMTAQEHAQLSANHPRHSIFVHEADINTLGRHYFGDEFDVRNYFTATRALPLRWDDDPRIYVSNIINAYDLRYAYRVGRPHLHYDHILAITERTGEGGGAQLVVTTIPFTVTPTSNGVFTANGQVLGYISGEAMAGFDDISNWPEHVYFRSEIITKAEYTLVRAEDGRLIVKDVNYVSVGLSEIRSQFG